MSSKTSLRRPSAVQLESIAAAEMLQREGINQFRPVHLHNALPPGAQHEYEPKWEWNWHRVVERMVEAGYLTMVEEGEHFRTSWFSLADGYEEVLAPRVRPYIILCPSCGSDDILSTDENPSPCECTGCGLEFIAAEPNITATSFQVRKARKGNQ